MSESDQVSAWVSEFQEVINDPLKRARFTRDPHSFLKPMNLDMNEPHLESFVHGLQMMAQPPNNGNEATQDVGLKATSSLDLEQFLNVKINLFGFVLQMDHQAVNQLPTGIDAIKKLAETTAEVMRVAGKGGPLAPFIAIGLLYWSAVFTAYALILPAIDQGKGVYLTVTWPQIYLAVASGGLFAMAAMPIPTAVV